MEHDIELSLAVWKELRQHIIGSDIESAADDFIHVLMEHGISADEIAEYGVDSVLKDVLREHIDDEDLFEEEGEYEDDDEELDVGWGR